MGVIGLAIIVTGADRCGGWKLLQLGDREWVTAMLYVKELLSPKRSRSRKKNSIDAGITDPDFLIRGGVKMEAALHLVHDIEEWL